MNEQQARDLHTAAVALAMKVRTDFQNGREEEPFTEEFAADADTLAGFVLALCEENKEHVVKLTPFPSPSAKLDLDCARQTDVGPFQSRAEAERTLRGAMTTGRFASGAIVTRERGS